MTRCCAQIFKSVDEAAFSFDGDLSDIPGLCHAKFRAKMADYKFAEGSQPWKKISEFVDKMRGHFEWAYQQSGGKSLTYGVCHPAELLHEVFVQKNPLNKQLFPKEIADQIDNIEWMVCFDYALLMSGDARNPKDVIQNFTESGYMPIPVDQARPRDLVCFYQDSGDPAHLGILREEGLIESKWGTTDAVYLHTLENAPESYGKKIVYLRPPVQEFLQEMFPKHKDALNKRARAMFSLAPNYPPISKNLSK